MPKKASPAKDGRQTAATSRKSKTEPRTHGGADDRLDQFDTLLAPAGGGRQRRPDRGLPGDDALRNLASTYLDVQRRLWPEQRDERWLPEPKADTVRGMAAAFRDRFVSGEPVGSAAVPAGLGIAVAYARYSCDHSNPRSLDQQLRNILERARRDDYFIPWDYVLADAAVSGTISDRRGYIMAKELILQPGIAALVIDELGRASRGMVEALRLGRILESRQRRLLGASDGFDSLVPQSKVILAVFAALHELFVEQLAAKVVRGQRDAFLQGRSIHGASLGYKRIAKFDRDGMPVVKSNGKQLFEMVVNDDEVPVVRRVFEMFATERLSPQKIARWMNERDVRGRKTWETTRVLAMLKRRTYIGAECHGMTYLVRDPETGRVTTKYRPEVEWLKRESPHLAIVDRELFDAAQKRLADCAAAYGKRSPKAPTRQSVYPTQLFELTCSCGHRLWLGRAGRYAAYRCPNGQHGKHGCTLKTYKAAKIVDETLTRAIANLLTTDRIEEIVKQANKFISIEAKRPRERPTALNKAIRELERERRNYADAIGKGSGRKVDVLVERLELCEDRLAELRQELRELETRNEPPPPPITKFDAQSMLENLLGLLKEDIATAAPVLAKLTGPIVIREGDGKASKGTPWIAEFTLNAVPMIAELAARKGCPTTSSLEYLTSRGWTSPIPVTVCLKAVPLYEQLAVDSGDKLLAGASMNALAKARRVTYQTVQEARKFRATGLRPNRPRSRQQARSQRSGAQSRAVPKYQSLAPQVVELRDNDGLSLARIATKLGIGLGTATRAYDFARPEDALAAVQRGGAVRRRTVRQLTDEQRRQILELLARGWSRSRIAKEIGCVPQTVSNVRDAARRSSDAAAA